eukprot:TRINITY_DN66222_c4_g8_i1.p1 TRINITY_DN66222_c4_g8~~TRINITY_DN66222_c4_g8_i1.p1  ORF type:complete len:879 (+),score=394.72 TRINITY_DN66222_c4_g8_i1:230-2638(+)
MVTQNAFAKGLEMAFDVDSSCPPTVVSDSARVRQVLLNLLTNAIKFTEEGYVRVRVSLVAVPETADGTFDDGFVLVDRSSAVLRFEVLDTGIGIDPDDLSVIFQRFQQADSSSTRAFQRGTGLGLAVSRRLVSRLGGTIGVNSSRDQGSRFWFTVRVGVQNPPPMPIVVNQQQRLLRQQVQQQQQRHQSELMAPPPHNIRKLLLAHANIDFLEMMEDELAFCGANITLATSLSNVKGSRFDLAFIDDSVLPPASLLSTWVKSDSVRPLARRVVFMLNGSPAALLNDIRRNGDRMTRLHKPVKLDLLRAVVQQPHDHFASGSMTQSSSSTTPPNPEHQLQQELMHRRQREMQLLSSAKPRVASLAWTNDTMNRFRLAAQVGAMKARQPAHMYAPMLRASDEVKTSDNDESNGGNQQHVGVPPKLRSTLMRSTGTHPLRQQASWSDPRPDERHSSTTTTDGSAQATAREANNTTDKDDSGVVGVEQQHPPPFARASSMPVTAMELRPFLGHWIDPHAHMSHPSFDGMQPTEADANANQSTAHADSSLAQYSQRVAAQSKGDASMALRRSLSATFPHERRRALLRQARKNANSIRPLPPQAVLQDTEAGSRAATGLTVDDVRRDSVSKSVSKSDSKSKSKSESKSKSKSKTDSDVGAVNSVPLRVLVVEDDDLNLSVISSMLRKLGHTVLAATNGREAIEQFTSRASSSEECVDVVLMDCLMPVMDGFAATKRIRRWERAHSRVEDESLLVPIVGCTAASNEQHMRMCSASGMNRSIIKPVRLSSLRVLLEQLTETVVRRRAMLL